jgi:prepilin-type N-terminal cleavage/methylation domain-containing protein
MVPVDPRTPGSHAQRGFSLLELVVVVAIAGSLLALSVPGYLNRASNERAVTAARTLAADLRTAQQEAVARRGDVSVSFSSSDQGCASYVMAGPSGLIKRACLPADVEWAPQPAKLTFHSVGVPSGGLHATLRSARTGRQYTVSVSAETGAVTDDTR